MRRLLSIASAKVGGCLACLRTCWNISLIFSLLAAEALTKPLFQSMTARASISSLFTKCCSFGKSYLFATITIGGLLVRLVLSAASAADTDERLELSVEEQVEEQMEELSDWFAEAVCWLWWWYCC